MSTSQMDTKVKLARDGMNANAMRKHGSALARVNAARFNLAETAPLQSQTIPPLSRPSKSASRVLWSSFDLSAAPKRSTFTVAVCARALQNFQLSCSLDFPEDWDDAEYREAYMEAAIEQGVAWQIRINREARKLSQTQLAKAIDTQQSAVSRLEDPEGGQHNLSTLIKVAHALQCALLVKFVPYSTLLRESEDLSPESQYAEPYEAERRRERTIEPTYEQKKIR